MYSGMAMLNLNEALFITFTMKKIMTILIHSMTETKGTFYKIYLGIYMICPTFLILKFHKKIVS